MAFSRPTLSTLVDRIQQDFISRLSLAGAVLRRSLVYVMSRVWAGAAHMMHGHLDYTARQLFPDTAEAEFLRRWGSIFGVSATPADFARGTVSLTGSNGSVIPAGTVLQRSDAAQYTTDADATIASGTATAAVTAKLAGADGTLTVGVILTLTGSISGVDPTVTVVSSTQDGTDPETDEAYRARVLEHVQSPAHGGNSTDYVEWAKEVAGVTRAWVYPRELGAGTVIVRFVRDNDAGPIPDSGEVAAVQSYINAKRPVTATVTVSAPVAAPLNFTIAVAPNTTAVKNAVQAELLDLLLREAEPGTTLLLSSIRTAIGVAAGLTDYTLTSPSADVTRTTGQLTTMGTITWA